MTEEKELREEETSKDAETTDIETDTEKTEVESNTEDVVEEVESEESEESTLEQQIETLKSEADAAQEKYLRLYAEFENYKRRIQKEADIQKTYRSQQVLTDIVPTLDNFERALQIEGDDESFVSLKKGVQMVYDSLIKALEENGLERIQTKGEQFDPNYHQAVIQDDNPEFESGAITEELQTGYKLKDRVLRASMVKVNQ
ncbi:nucleotide exchange factor GrpE [Staphylococcus sp. 17KM0847]|uniref:nucleotide exchange factor GrpE n=1 Tax=Staphylococcus sp. 17KM0847 TaxID=2583989 RepID=UPI0015DBED2D|nr:nucleotide exchange factor GrpE [Staphylococcus sp. 17KM0847]QLK86039.1 nucleotide exchange factor GrpE [Staphylococcus sp. 17KM0847]